MWNMESLVMFGVVLVVTLLSHQAATRPTEVGETRPTDVGEKNEEINNLEKELKLQMPKQEVSPKGEHLEDIGEWGDTINGINVGNVIRDVLITLRDHPEIVQKLIQDEERSLAEKVFSSERTDLALPIEDISDFQQPSLQLQQSQKRVVKKNFKYESKRQKETPEETIDMTDPVEGGSIEDDNKSTESGEVKYLIEDTENLLRDGTQQPTGLKRSKPSSEEESSNLSSESREHEQSGEKKEEVRTKDQKGAYWKNYGKQKQKQKPRQKWRMYKENGKSKDRSELDSTENNKSYSYNVRMQNSDKDVSKGEFWKNYGKNKDKQSKEVTSKADYWKNSDNKSDVSKGKYWKHYGKQMEESQENVDSPELDASDDSNENELFNLNEEQEGSPSASM